MAIAVWTSFEQITDSTGTPVSGAKVNVYSAGTTTPVTVYSDSGLSSAAANPIICDSAGQHAIRYIAAASYKVAVTDSSDVALTGWSKDNIDPGVPVGSGALAIASGGTGATTAATARTNLDVPANSVMTSAQSDIATVQSRLGSTDGTELAAGTTGQRPGSPIAGEVRWNSTTSELEFYDGSSWQNIKHSGKASSASAVLAETAEDTFIRPDTIKNSPRTINAWGRVTVSGGTPTLTDGFNISSTITDNGAGDFSFTFSTAMADGDYAVVGSSYGNAFSVFRLNSAVAPATTGFRVILTDSAGTPTDPTGFSFIVIGDLT